MIQKVKSYTFAVISVAICTATLAINCSAAELDVSLLIKDHRFEPSEIRIPANQRVRLSVHNKDSSAEEFESKTLKREKLIPGGGKATILIGPLKPGKYEFIGEFHDATAHGVIVAE